MTTVTVTRVLTTECEQLELRLGDKFKSTQRVSAACARTRACGRFQTNHIGMEDQHALSAEDIRSWYTGKSGVIRITFIFSHKWTEGIFLSVDDGET